MRGSRIMCAECASALDGSRRRRSLAAGSPGRDPCLTGLREPDMTRKTSMTGELAWDHATHDIPETGLSTRARG